jgi:oligoendopeptidase F
MTYYLDMFRTTIFRQTMFAEFEYIIHTFAENNKPLTHQVLSEEYLKLNKKYYGTAVTHDEQIKIEWSRIPHFYYNFYVYKYATGLISAVTIVEGILNDTTGKKLKNYIDFLKSGGSDSPVELLKIAGVDLTVQVPFDVAFKSFESTLRELTDKD